jgi:hypothetical protein
MKNETKRKISEFLNGRRTRTGSILLILAGLINMGELYNVIFGQVAESLVMISIAMIGWGLWARMTKIFYPTDGETGRANIGRLPKTKRGRGLR